ncbi:MAG: chemotaxis protein CheA [Desulfarculales bacterium]|jgi:two-component system chemotaxis sensor kinase CheA|nr:chemotaxis protein CheA [Desulfarculales bacterium]
MEDKLLNIFYDESAEIIDTLEKGLVELEGSDDPEEINAVFRAAHTLKGNAGIVGFSDLVDLTHLMEGLLDKMRAGVFQPDAANVGLLLSGVDALKVLIHGYIAGDPPQRPQDLMELMAQRLGEEVPHSFPGDDQKNRTDQSGTEQELSGQFHISLRLSREVLGTGSDPLQLFLELEEMGSFSRVECHIEELPHIEDLAVDGLYLYWDIWMNSQRDQDEISEVFVFLQDRAEVNVEKAEGKTETDSAAAPDVTEVKAPPGAVPAPPPRADEKNGRPENRPAGPGGEKPAPPPAPKAPAHPAASSAATIRVETDKLDKLVNLVGELVIGAARVNQIAGMIHSQELSSAVESLGHISRDLQEQVMRVRMIAVEGTFSRFQRVVRDLAAELGKKIRLQMSGTETELDKNVIEQIADPLKHLIRNSADHGLETPQERLAAGKPEQGTIWLKAYQQEGKIIIEVADDGAGINREKVMKKAAEKGWVTADSQISDSEVFAFMFQPGFSTADKVSEVSGRGVGLDVVRQNIESLRGSVEVESKHGQGTTFRIKLPLTLAIIDGMTVSVGKEIITIPLLSIVESLRPTTSDLIVVENKGELVSVRGEFLPLVRLYKVFGFETERTDATAALVVIIESIGRRFGMMVDDILGEQQAVIKSLEHNYQKVQGITGATILGDGRVSLILDIHGLEKLVFDY